MSTKHKCVLDKKQLIRRSKLIDGRESGDAQAQINGAIIVKKPYNRELKHTAICSLHDKSNH